MTSRAPRLRVVIDSNIWLSGIIFGGNPKRILELFISDAITVVMSEELMTELRRKIVQKFPKYIQQLELFETSIRKDAEFVSLGSITITASRDVDDNKFLETAVIGGCSHIISGDKDLLSLKSYDGVQIETASEFLNHFE